MSEELDNIDEQAAIDLASGIKRSVVGDETVELHDPVAVQKARDMIAAREDSVAAATKPHFGLRFSQLVPPGGGG